jgi:hypothetical protein
VGAFFNQVLHQHRLDFKVSAAKIVATGTFVRYYHIAEVLVFSLAHACITDSEDGFAALTFELQLFHLLSKLFIQGLELICGLLSALAASLIFIFGVEFLLFFQAKYFLAVIAHHRINGKVGTEGANEVLN